MSWEKKKQKKQMCNELPVFKIEILSSYSLGNQRAAHTKTSGQKQNSGCWGPGISLLGATHPLGCGHYAYLKHLCYITLTTSMAHPNC